MTTQLALNPHLNPKRPMTLVHTMHSCFEHLASTEDVLFKSGKDASRWFDVPLIVREESRVIWGLVVVALCMVRAGSPRGPGFNSWKLLSLWNSQSYSGIQPSIFFPWLLARYYTREETINAIRYISGTKLDDRIIRTDLDLGFVEGRQFGRGKTGGQVRVVWQVTEWYL